MITRRLFGFAAAGLSRAAAPAANATPQSGPGVVNVLDYGAIGKGTELDTKALQSAIDTCSKSGGGLVLFPRGMYLSGTIELKSGVTLHLMPGAILMGSKSLGDYPHKIPALRSYTDNYTRTSLIYAEGQENIGIEGAGVLDGQGAAFEGPYLVRPYLMRLVNCRGVTVTGVTIQHSPMWVQHYLACEDVHIHGVKVRSQSNRNNDGIDIDSCRRVRISDCDINSQDDAIVLKSTTNTACEDVVVTNCVISSLCNGIKLGTESNGGFRNIAISNCSIYDTRLAGIALECVDGGTLDRVVVSGIVMHNVQCPIFVRLGDRGRPISARMPRPPLGFARNVTISNVQATGAGKIGCSVTSVPERMLENVSLSNISLEFAGGGTVEQARRAIPEEREHYPEHHMFGVLPSYGLFCRHVRGLSLDHIRLRTEKPDLRPALVCDDVEDVTVRAVSAGREPGAEPVIHFANVRGALVQGCRSRGGVFVRVAGERSESISLWGNDLGPDAVGIDPSAPAASVHQN